MHCGQQQLIADECASEDVVARRVRSRGKKVGQPAAGRHPRIDDNGYTAVGLIMHVIRFNEPAILIIYK